MPSDHTIQSLGPATAAPATHHEDCPECDGPVRQENHETVCTDCGLVIDADQIDHGPDWRDYTDPESSKHASPVTPTKRHDKGLGTTISHKRDAGGTQLSSEKRRQLGRLRTQHSRARAGSKQERNQIKGLTDIKRMANALGLPEHVLKQACVLFKTGQDNDLLTGRCIEGFATAALYAAARINETPRTIADFAHVSKVDRSRLTTSYSVLNQELDLPVPPARPIEYLPQLISAVDAPPRLEHQTADRLEALANTVYQGRKPAGVAAAAIYHTATTIPGVHITQVELGEAADVSPVTIRTVVADITDSLTET
jgi:transcription initiation factor TFIIB